MHQSTICVALHQTKSIVWCKLVLCNHAVLSDHKMSADAIRSKPRVVETGKSLQVPSCNSSMRNAQYAVRRAVELYRSNGSPAVARLRSQVFQSRKCFSHDSKETEKLWSKPEGLSVSSFLPLRGAQLYGIGKRKKGSGLLLNICREIWWTKNEASAAGNNKRAHLSPLLRRDCNQQL